MSQIEIRMRFRQRHCDRCADRQWHTDRIYHHSHDGFGVYVKQCNSCKWIIYEVQDFVLDSKGTLMIKINSWLKYTFQKISSVCVVPTLGSPARRRF